MSRTVMILAALLVAWTTVVFAQSYKVGAIEVERAWLRATPKGATTAAGYFRITNSGTSSDRLIGGSLAVASRVEIHEMTTANGVAQMRPLPAGLEIKPGATVELKPGSFHAMFAGLKAQLRQGEHIKGTLVFENAGPLEVEYNVESIGAQQPMGPGMKNMH